MFESRSSDEALKILTLEIGVGTAYLGASHIITGKTLPINMKEWLRTEDWVARCWNTSLKQMRKISIVIQF